jgi:hypothetical protein
VKIKGLGNPYKPLADVGASAHFLKISSPILLIPTIHIGLQTTDMRLYWKR